jgi:pseudouridine-5'-phosphate glycosidase
MLAKSKNHRPDRSVTPQFSVCSKVSIGRIIQIIVFCIFVFATGLLYGMHIGANYNTRNNDLQNQLIELRTQQAVIKGQFKSIQTLHYDLRSRVEIIEEKYDRFIKDLRRVGPAITQ